VYGTSHEGIKENPSQKKIQGEPSTKDDDINIPKHQFEISR
jgi:hypothetical protein